MKPPVGRQVNMRIGKPSVVVRLKVFSDSFTLIHPHVAGNEPATGWYQ